MQANVDIAYNLILGGLSPEEFNKTYDFTVGFNELITNNNVVYQAELEYLLCKKLLDNNIKYSWGSIAVGNLDADVLVKNFQKVLEIAYSTCYHLYLQPNNLTIENNNYFIKRPIDWQNACAKANIRFPVLFGGESGTYFSWKNVERITEQQYFNVQTLIDKEFSSWNIPKLGFCLFSIGCEGSVGTDWNISDLSMYKSYNESLPVVNKNIAGINAWIWYAGDLTNASQNVNSLIIKYSDGTMFGDQNDNNVFRRQFQKWCPVLKSENFKVYAYGYIYLGNPVQEATVIAQAILQDNADGIILDVEYEAIGKSAKVFMDTLRNLVGVDAYIAFSPDLRILTGSKFPFNFNVDLLTEPFPWDDLVNTCDAILPQLYYTDFKTNVNTTFKLLETFTRAFPNKNITIIPVVPANTTLDDLKLSVQECKNRNLSSISIWRYDDFNNFQELKGLFNMFNDAELAIIGEQIFFVGAKIPFNPTSAITKAWIAAWKAGDYLGRPRGSEYPAGRFVCQEFELGNCWALVSDYSQFGYKVS